MCPKQYHPSTCARINVAIRPADHHNMTGSQSQHNPDIIPMWPRHIMTGTPSQHDRDKITNDNATGTRSECGGDTITAWPGHQRLLVLQGPIVWLFGDYKFYQHRPQAVFQAFRGRACKGRNLWNQNECQETDQQACNVIAAGYATLRKKFTSPCDGPAPQQGTSGPESQGHVKDVSG